MQKVRIILFILAPWFFLLQNYLLAQTPEKTSLFIMPEVAFLQITPVIDGSLDENLQNLVIRKFNPYILKMNPDSPVNSMTYRMAYGTRFFYLFIEVDADSYICRDRGFQNGDGFMLSLTIPQFQNQRTEELYILGFYPSQDRDDPFKELVWDYNDDFLFNKLSEECEFVVKADKGKIGYELLLPWHDVYPYHPWLSESIGFNLFFIKAIGETDMNMHGVVMEEFLPLQENLLLYKRLKFQMPKLLERIQSYMIMDRNCYEGESIQAKVATTTGSSTNEEIQTIILKEDQTQYSNIFEIHAGKGLTIAPIEIPVYDLLTDNYHLNWNSLTNESSGQIELTILPNFLFDDLYLDLDNIKTEVSNGSLHTMQFYLEDIEKRKEELKAYENCPGLQKDFVNFLDLLEKSKAGQDVLAHKTGIFRRAYYFNVEMSLRPYSVKIPKDYNLKNKYPLLVFLHSSDKDDRELAAHSDYISSENFIQVAPYGREARNCYTTIEAQVDIREAIKDVMRNYSIDSTNIILAGFEMGGYGVYRTFYETPGKYKALAIFSGQPDLASHYFPGESHPNFLNQDNLDIFKDIPIFIFHGEKDRTAPFELTEEVVEKLKRAGAKVHVITEKNTGHSSPAKQTVLEYHKWLNMIIKK